MAEEGSDDNDEGGAAPPQLTARKLVAAATAKQQQFQPRRRPRPSLSSSASPSDQMPASLRVPPARLEALTNSGPLAPTAATLSAVAADERLVALLDDADVMESVSRISQNSDLFQRELQLLARKGKAGDLLELYRRMAAVAAKRCEAFCGEEGGKGEGKGTATTEEKKNGKGAPSSSPLSAGLCEREGLRQQQKQQSCAGIEVIR